MRPVAHQADPVRDLFGPEEIVGDHEDRRARVPLPGHEIMKLG
ncbi:MAG: hypothetical protein ACK4FB_01520 [Brevundimonas sp.]